MINTPAIRAITVPDFPAAELNVLPNGMHLYGYNGAFNDILRLELVFDGGRWTEKAPLTAEATAKMFKSGTSDKSAFQLESAIDALGATIKASAGYHGFTISLFTMRKHLKETISLLIECLNGVNFPDEELSIHQRNALSKLKVNEEKTDFMAEMVFKEALFGAKHPYGYKTLARDIQQLNTAVIGKYYDANVRSIMPDLFLAGRFNEHDIQIITDAFSEFPPRARQSQISYEAEPFPEQRFRINKAKSTQVTIMLGKRLFNKQHPDYPGFVLLNTIFGGYFGSRLMTNIREDKGYTYGIYSSLQTYRHDGAFYIQTDTGTEYLDACLREIQAECDRICSSPPDTDEIRQAKNYLMGKFLTRMDGPFATMETFKNYSIEGLEIHMFNNFVKNIADTTPEQLQQLAERYLRYDSFVEVIAGG